MTKQTIRGKIIPAETIESIWKELTKKTMPKIAAWLVGNDEYKRIFCQIKNSSTYRDLSLEMGEITNPAIPEDSAGFTTSMKEGYMIIIRTTDVQRNRNEITIDIAIEPWREVLRHELQHIVKKQI